MGKELLLEIGTEEIPAAFLPQAMRDMKENIRREFALLMIRHGEITTMATPRRLVLSVADIAEMQEDRVLEKLGPARRAAFDGAGNPTPAATGFARGQQVDIASLTIIATEKGEYVAVRKTIRGEETKALLPVFLPKFITSIPFRKSMRWANYDLSFARPVHWILALFGGEIVPFRLEDIESGNRSYGHRFLHPAAFTVTGLEDYRAKARECFVIVDPEERRRLIVREADTVARSLSGKALYNEDLLDTVTNIVEYPSVISGSFDAAYLALPKEVLTTSMMTQQKYFPLTDEQGNLLPHFLTVMNGRPRDPSVVSRGNEKVIRARLSDAKFFFEEDRKVPLEDCVEDLRGVVFHTLLGTSYEKMLRFRELAGELASLVNPELKERVCRIATLAKADLCTQMVGEFPELQGVMGREYALLCGEDPRVACGISEHYLPLSTTGDLPESEEGALVSMADKLDSIAGFFGVNLVPTGTADPYALRRQALGLINIILAKGYSLSLDDLIDRSLAILGGRLKRPAADVKADILAFFSARLENQLISQGHPYDIVDAVLVTDASHFVKAVKKIEALEQLQHDADFTALATAFRRVVNIVKDFSGGAIDPRLFENDAEGKLYDGYCQVSETAMGLVDADAYGPALREIARLRPLVDEFFNAVLVMAEDDAIRVNRMSLLAAIASLFKGIADFSKIVATT